MSYVMRTPKGKIIVIDGGNPGDAPYLRQFLAGLGGKVEAWFLTHPHSDHMSAFIDIIQNPNGLKIDRIYASLPDEKWSEQYDSQNGKDTLINVNEALHKAGRTAIELVLGADFIIDNMHFKVLGIKNPDILTGTTNNSSIVLKVWDKKKSVLFLGDLGLEAGEKLLRGKYAAELHADYVQMAHHGQDGAGEDVYKAIHPTYCLWPTPIWLWDNNAGQGKGTGPWKTLETRKWMQDLGVKHDYVTGVNGLVKID